ncbi:MAG TPA: magnesium transporter CorA family protein [Patescibacteria group bacterium]|nr:magnesium transporter CorA family protein [Patescibacteria group bacterium]
MHNYQKISDRVEYLIIDNPRNESGGVRWVNIVNAGKSEINYLRKNYSFDLAHLRSTAASVLTQRPIIFKNQNYLFLILHFPTLIDDRVVAGEINFFVGHEFLVTAHNNNLPALNRFFNLGKKDPNSLLSFSLESSAILLYEIIERLINDCYGLLDNNSVEIEKVEDLIFSGEQKAAVSKILLLRRNIINIRKIVQNHKNILKELTRMKSSLIDPAAIKKHYSILVEDSKRLWENLDNQREMVEVLNSTNESLLNNQMNTVMKTLTVFSVIVFPLTLLAAIFGMNSINMPFAKNPMGFWIIISIMLSGTLGMVLLFKSKRWI